MNQLQAWVNTFTLTGEMTSIPISVVIPTLNERDYLSKTINTTLIHASNSDQLEILVVDAGSEDDSLALAEHLDCHLFEKPEFKYKKYLSLNYGLGQANGEMIIFLDADTELPEHFDVLVRRAYEEGYQAGAFEFDFTERTWLLKVLVILNRIRYKIDRNYFGDQAIFCRKEFAMKIGGYPDSDLMEAALFCKKIRRSGGRLKLIKTPIKTSSRRFDNYGFFKVLWFDLKAWIRFTFGMNVDHQGKDYWSERAF